jgi:hypothetical protein
MFAGSYDLAPHWKNIGRIRGVILGQRAFGDFNL